MPEETKIDALTKALDYTLANEGGFSNHRADRGGATMFGITQGTLSKWRGKSVTISDVMSLTQAEAKEIYREWYWRVLKCDEIHSTSVAIALFDIGVVCGPAASSRLAERVCDHREKDSSESVARGRSLTERINQVDPDTFIREFAALVEARFLYLVKLRPSQKVFERGWRKRAQRLLSLIGETKSSL